MWWCRQRVPREAVEVRRVDRDLVGRDLERGHVAAGERLAGAGQVLDSPFRQDALNRLLAHMLVSDQRVAWRQNGISFGKTAVVYSLP